LFPADFTVLDQHDVPAEAGERRRLLARREPAGPERHR
jgi:hypothetical protein